MGEENISGNDQQARSALLRHMIDHAGNEDCRLFGTNPRTGIFLEIPKLELEAAGEQAPALNEAYIAGSLQAIHSRVDCADFTMTGVLRILYRYPHSRLLTDRLRKSLVETVLGFKYWVDESGHDEMCMHTENHMILFHSNQLLAGQLYPDQIFPNSGKSGKEHARQAAILIGQWIAWRARFGFSEWNSKYYHEDLLALLNVSDYAADAQIRSKARQLIDLILLQMAIGSIHGVFGTSSGRAYADTVMNPRKDPSGVIGALLWGKGAGVIMPTMSGIMMAASGYRLPPLIRRIALDEPQELETFERHSLDMDEAAGRNVNPEEADNLWFFWGAQQYEHRQTIENAYRLTKYTQYMRHGKFSRWRSYYLECERMGLSYDPDPTPQALTRAEVYTYRTPDYMLSCVQDYRKGKQGYQQHIWQATLGVDALVFTTHPGAMTLNKSARPNYWHGNMLMPRAAAYKNVLLCIYWSKPDMYVTPFTHAYFPSSAFDETREEGGWVFGRKGDGYIALRALSGMRWGKPEDVAAIYAGWDWAQKLPEQHELIAPGPSAVWICELGNPINYASFERFVAEISASSVAGDAVSVEYLSPILGKVEFGWNSPFKVGEQVIPLSGYPRLSNRYCDAPFDSLKYEIRHGDERHLLDFT